MINNALYYGDNLQILREYIADESVDLIYLDPPFNSKATYNVLFRAPSGEQSTAQIEAFEDTWHWTDEAERAFDEVLISGNTDAAEMLRAMRSFLKENDMMAYLTMMAVRLLELRRILKKTGTLYLHCDPTASHYLKVVMDAIFGKKNFLNEIVWCYDTGGRSTTSFPKKHDIILRYAHKKNAAFYYDNVALPRDFSTMHEVILTDEDGRKYQRNFKAGKEYRYYIDRGVLPNDWWADIQALNPAAKERLSYPTQKPLALLDRIIKASSDIGDVVLDPFCGCGTAVHAAQRLDRQWIGIDITHLAVSLIEKRLNDAFPGIKYEVHGTPKDLDGARALAAADKYQFQWWAVSLVNAIPFGGKKKGADTGIDGLIYFKPDGKTTEKAVVSVKGGAHVSVAMIRDLGHVVEREGAKIGVFIALASPTGPMTKEAIKAGFYETDYGKYPKLQILTIEGLFAGKKPALPLVDPSGFKKAAREDMTEQGKLI
jgi:site-specific DNA-methyltransferase (adenine-specific)